MDKEFRLPKDFGQRWLKDLRSGKYDQTSGILYRNHRYCCLGIAACITANNGHLFMGTIPLKSLVKDVPEEIRGSLNTNPLVYRLTNMNDAGCSFLEIANWIEQNVNFY